MVPQKVLGRPIFEHYLSRVLNVMNIMNNNVHINVSNKECSNIDLKLRKKKNKKMIERKKVPFINFFV